MLLCILIYICSSGEIKSKAKSKDETTQLKVEVLRMLSDELIESERWIFSALHLLKETVRSSAANSLDRVSVLSNLVNTLTSVLQCSTIYFTLDVSK